MTRGKKNEKLLLISTNFAKKFSFDIVVWLQIEISIPL